MKENLIPGSIDAEKVLEPAHNVGWHCTLGESAQAAIQQRHDSVMQRCLLDVSPVDVVSERWGDVVTPMHPQRCPDPIQQQVRLAAVGRGMHQTDADETREDVV